MTAVNQPGAPLRTAPLPPPPPPPPPAGAANQAAAAAPPPQTLPSLTQLPPLPQRQPVPSSPYHQTSPTTHAATSPSTVQASPLSTPLSASLPNGTPNGLKTADTPKQRARLACMQCRKSKIRCSPSEDDVDFTKPCSVCAKNGRPCVWPNASNTTPLVKNKTSSAGMDVPMPDRLPEPRKRKKVAPAEMKTEADGDFYNPHLFTEQVWKDLYTIFKQHYVTELPFLHEASFLPMLKQTDIQSLPDSFAPLILALLSLTVPFHDELVHHLSQGSRLSAIQVSRVYADAAEQKIYDTRALDHPSIRLVQALLMLSLHAHGDGHGSKSSITLGNAISCMQLLGCHYEKELDDKADKIKRPLAQPKPDPSTTVVEESFIVDEIKRRTFWSCYIIDRYISSGDYKPRRINIKEALVQLPCSQDAFLHGIYKTKTRMLRETNEHFQHRRERYTQSRSEEKDVEWEDEDKQEPLVWYIKALDLYEDVMKWACTVTRRNERDPPWVKTFVDKSDRFGGRLRKEKRLSFANLDERLTEFTDSLPTKLRLARSRTLAHIHGQTSTPFFLLHSVLALCNIVLHREWLPFLPDPESGPTGPVDGPNCHQFKERAHSENPRFWEASAARCFEATKNVLDLMWLCKQQGALVETPFTSFVLFTVVCTIMWCGFFPYMDTRHFVCSGKGQPDVIENFNQAAALLHSMQDRLHMASTWCKISKEYVSTLIEARKHWKGTVGSPGSGPADNNNRGLDLYKPVEMKLKSFGSQLDDGNATQEPPMNLTDILRALEDSLKRMNDNIKSEDSVTAEKTTEASSTQQLPENAGFTTINQHQRSGQAIASTNHTMPVHTQQVHQTSARTHGHTDYRDTLATTVEIRQPFAPSSMYESVRPGGVGTNYLDGSKYSNVNAQPNSTYPFPEGVDQFNKYYQHCTWSAFTDSSQQAFLGNNYVPIPLHEFYGAHGYYHEAQTE